MIVPMKHFDLVCLASDREPALKRLRDLGVAHLDLASASGAEVAAAKGEAADAEKAVRLILKARDEHLKASRADGVVVRAHTPADVLALADDRETLRAAAEELARLVCVYEPYGDFDPALANKLAADGVRLVLGEKGAFSFETDGSGVKGAVPYPEMRLSRLREKLARVENRIAIDTAKLAECDEKEILRSYPKLADKIAFESAKALMGDAGALTSLSGWVPETNADDLRFQAGKSGWALLLREPAAGETPPTLVRPPKLFRPMKALFEGLGIAPAYTEADVSVPFFAYFSLFFAMLVGDGAYGAIFLAGTLLMRRKLPKAWFVLLTVFSVATVGWGILSNTWFGAQLPFLAGLPTVAWLADPSYHNMMFLCFTIGVSHLMLARIWNGLCLINDTTCLAQFGWAGVLLFMYLVTNSIVGIFPGIPTWGYWVMGVSLVCVFGFTVKPSELKTRGAELGMLPLNVMSALGDIISYVRLFAVGLASVKVAENFNAMATGLVSDGQALWVKVLMIVAMALILVLGHALNLAMAGLSILVHAVRLNTLEFSNHKGVSWAGYAFRAFAKRS